MKLLIVLLAALIQSGSYSNVAYGQMNSYNSGGYEPSAEATIRGNVDTTIIGTPEVRNGQGSRITQVSAPVYPAFRNTAPVAAPVLSPSRPCTRIISNSIYPAPVLPLMHMPFDPVAHRFYTNLVVSSVVSNAAYSTPLGYTAPVFSQQMYTRVASPAVYQAPIASVHSYAAPMMSTANAPITPRSCVADNRLLSHGLGLRRPGKNSYI